MTLLHTPDSTRLRTPEDLPRRQAPHRMATLVDTAILHRPRATALTEVPASPWAGRALAVLRVATGFVFLWAFLDKTFGLGFSTPSGRAWIHGGSPTKGFLSAVDVGPLASWFNTIAGDTWADWLFMVGLAGIGIALVVGVAVRLAALAGMAMMVLMWLAEFPPAQHTGAGQATGSTNPVVDYHFLYAVALLVLAVTASGRVWGLGRQWARLPYVRRHRWAQ